MKFPRMIKIRQKLNKSAIENLSEEIEAKIKVLRLQNKILKGQTVAVACSSRGITSYDIIVKATITSLERLGLKPFIIPAMGSHGGATAKGQRHVLDNAGISEKTMDVPIRSSLKTVQFGETKDHIPVLLDSYAAKSDYIVPVNRIKSHTDFEHDIESGLMKMIAIGLGKQKGAEIYHQACFQYGFPRVILSVARKILENGKILFGVGIVENGYSQPAQVEALLPIKLEEREKELLKISKQMEPRLPFEEVDILIIDQMGKDISGSGIDTKVVGRILIPLLTEEPKTPRVKRIVICDFSPKSGGNALGIGLADFVTKRLVDKIDFQATYINLITSSDPEHGRIPVTLSCDREAIEVAMKSIHQIAPNKLNAIRIKNTKYLAEIDISESYREELMLRKDLEIIREATPLSFDTYGNLKPF